MEKAYGKNKEKGQIHVILLAAEDSRHTQSVHDFVCDLAPLNIIVTDVNLVESVTIHS